VKNPMELVLEPLLRSWSEVEPDRCKDAGTDDFMVKLGGRWKYVLEDDAELDLASVQAAVQEACETRGWGWTLDCYHSKRYGALRNLAWLTVTPEHCESDAAKAAVALLTAYLAARKAETRGDED
jgi:hypothetical protein